MKIVPLLLLLAGCATVPAGEEESYGALGTEPFWSITIANGRMTYDSPEGRFSVRAPRGEELGDGRMWSTRRITLQSSNQECSDGMSDNRYPQTVHAVVDGRALEGCGGEVLPPVTLAGTSWAIVEVDGQAVAGDNYRLEIGQDRLSGQAGCNRFSGSLSITSDTLTPGPIASTRMACGGERMAIEARALAIIGKPMGIQMQDGDDLVLAGEAGTLRLRRAP